MPEASPTSYLEAQTRYRDLTYQKALLGDIKGRREKTLAERFTAGISAIFAVFPDFDPKKDYSMPVEAADTEKPATLSEIQALANSIPIPSLGAQGSSQAPLTTDTAVTGMNTKTLIGLGLGAAVILVAGIYFFKR